MLKSASGRSPSEKQGTDFISYDRCGVSRHAMKRIAKWSVGARDTGNMLIQGDNLSVLHYMTALQAGTVRCAYLDPPYNNGESYRHYFDSMGHDEWLSSVVARIEKIRTLLREDGSIWISIDDSELHYLKVAVDSIFGRSNFVGTVIWERRTTRENRKALSKNHEYLLVYAKNASLWTQERNTLPLTKEAANR